MTTLVLLVAGAAACFVGGGDLHDGSPRALLLIPLGIWLLSLCMPGEA